MPLPLSAVARRHVHTRRVTCEAFERTDALWDIDASMTDVKTYDTQRGKAGTPLHHMWVRLTIDTDYVIKDIAAAMDAFPQAACPFAVNPMQELIGVKIGSGWQSEVRKRIGRRYGQRRVNSSRSEPVLVLGGFGAGERLLGLLCSSLKPLLTDKCHWAGFRLNSQRPAR